MSAPLRAAAPSGNRSRRSQPVPTPDENDSIVAAIALANAEDSTSFPVLSADEGGKVVGFVTVKRIMSAYQEILDRVAKEEHSFAE